MGLAIAALCGCSPTYQSLYEGDVRFEHCYRVDEERQVPVNDKLQCWRDWTRHYRHGQSRDRVGYAHARERALAAALAGGQQAAPRGAGRIDSSPLPQPTSAFAPPPPTMTPAAAAERIAASEPTRVAHTGQADAGARTEGSPAVNDETKPLLADAPGASCAGACGKGWNGCKQQCKSPPCRSGCDDQYRGCMRACF